MARAGDRLTPTNAGAVVPGGNGRIAFSSLMAGTTEIVGLDPCGATRTLIGGPGHIAPCVVPRWPAHRVPSNHDGDFEIYVADADGSDVVAVTDDPGGDLNPAWSPDGRRIAWNSDRNTGDFEIYVMRDDGTDVTRLTNAQGIDSVPSWSPRATGSRSSRAVTGTPRCTCWVPTGVISETCR